MMKSTLPYQYLVYGAIFFVFMISVFLLHLQRFSNAGQECIVPQNNETVLLQQKQIYFS